MTIESPAQTTGSTVGSARIFKTWAAIAAGFSVLCAALFIFAPRTRKYLTHEDRYLEQLTALLFVLAFGFGVYRIARARRAIAVRFAIAIPLLGLLGFLDEISFGERAFGLDMPSVGGNKIDGAHDLIFVAWDMLRRFGNIAIYVALGVGLGVATGSAAWRFRAQVAGLPALMRRSLPLAFFALFAIFLALAIPLDLEILAETDLTKAVEEMLEFHAALALMFSALAISPRRAERANPGAKEDA